MLIFLLATVDFQYFWLGEVKYPSAEFDHHSKNTVDDDSSYFKKMLYFFFIET